MNTTNKDIAPHPHFLDMLFSHKSNVSAVFNDVLGLHEIDHIAISCINEQQELSTFSSTPALEFNLFKSSLWRFDRTYQDDWYQLCSSATWEALYSQSRYDELYYIKQIKHHYPLGLSLAAKLDGNYFIYSMASHRNCGLIRELFAEQNESFYKIGEYCTKALMPLFMMNSAASE